MLADTKLRMERTEDTPPRKIPGPERSARFSEQQGRISGLVIDGLNEPSFALLDLCQQQAEEDAIKHITLEQCTCRIQELQGIKRDRTVETDSSGYFKVSSKPQEQTASLGSDHKIRTALLRRALAYDQSGVMSFDALERWHNLLYSTMDREPPPGYSAVSMSQAMAADKNMFVLLAEECRTGLSRDANGLLPADEALKSLSKDARITFILLPLPGRSSGSNAGSQILDGQPPPTGRPSKKARRDAAIAAAAAAGLPKGTKGLGKGRGKGKGKGKFELPPALAGMWKIIKGDRACTDFNLPCGCTLCAVGEKCTKGIHLCMKPRCGGAHSLQECTFAG
jgi:hypothetical protein